MTFAGNLDRFDYSCELRERYPEPLWLLSVDRVPTFSFVSNREVLLRHLAQKGFDTATIVTTDTCTSTYSELTVLQRVIESSEPLSGIDTLHIGLVSSPYHMRRIIGWANRLMDGREIRWYSLPVPPHRGMRRQYHPDEWWRHEEDALFVFSEYIKLLYYSFKY